MPSVISQMVNAQEDDIRTFIFLRQAQTLAIHAVSNKPGVVFDTERVKNGVDDIRTAIVDAVALEDVAVIIDTRSYVFITVGVLYLLAMPFLLIPAYEHYTLIVYPIITLFVGYPFFMRLFMGDILYRQTSWHRSIQDYIDDRAEQIKTKTTLLGVNNRNNKAVRLYRSVFP